MHCVRLHEPIQVVSTTGDGAWHTVDLSGIVGNEATGAILILRGGCYALFSSPNYYSRSLVQASPDHNSFGSVSYQHYQGYDVQTYGTHTSLSIVRVPLTAAKTFDYYALSGMGSVTIYLVGQVEPAGSGLIGAVDLIPVPSADGSLVSGGQSSSFLRVVPPAAPPDAIGWLGRIMIDITDMNSNCTGTLSLRPSDDWSTVITQILRGWGWGDQRMCNGIFPLADSGFEYALTEDRPAEATTKAYIDANYWLVPAPMGGGYNFGDFQPANETLVSGGTATSATAVTVDSADPYDVAVLTVETYEGDTSQQQPGTYYAYIQERILSDHRPICIGGKEVTGHIAPASRQRDTVRVRLDGSKQFNYYKAGHTESVTITLAGLIKRIK